MKKTHILVTLAFDDDSSDAEMISEFARKDLSLLLAMFFLMLPLVARQTQTFPINLRI